MFTIAMANILYKTLAWAYTQPILLKDSGIPKHRPSIDFALFTSHYLVPDPIIAINIKELIDLKSYQIKIEKMISEFKNSRSLKNKKIYLPGQIENELRFQYIKDGIPLNGETISNLSSTLKELKIKKSLNSFLKN